MPFVMEWIGEAAAESINSKKFLSSGEELKPEDVVYVGVYMNGMHVNDFMTRRVFSWWHAFATSPYTLAASVALGIAKSETWGPKPLLVNIGSTVLVTYIVSTIVCLIPLFIAMIFDLLVMVPWMIYHGIGFYEHRDNWGDKGISTHQELKKWKALQNALKGAKRLT